MNFNAWRYELNAVRPAEPTEREAKPQSSCAALPFLPKRLAYDFTNVARQAFGGENPLQSCLGMRLPPGVGFQPAIKPACDARSDLGIELVDHDHLVGREFVAAAVCASAAASAFP